MAEIQPISNSMPVLPFNELIDGLPETTNTAQQASNINAINFTPELNSEIQIPERLQEEINENVREFFERPESYKRLIEQINQLAKRSKYFLRFGLFGEANQLFVKVLDRNSQSVIKIVPMRELMELREKLIQQAGIFVDEEA